MRIVPYKTNDGTELVALYKETDTVARVLGTLDPADIGILWGSGAREDYSEYTRNLKLRYPSSVVAGSQSVSIFDAARRTNLYAKTRNRVESFLYKDTPYHMPAYTSNQGAVTSPDVFAFCLNSTENELFSFLSERYVKSRRVREGAAEEFLAYWGGARTLAMSGPVVINVWSRVTYQCLIYIWMALNRPSTGPLLLVVDGAPPPWMRATKFAKAYERDYVNIEQLFLEASKVFGLPEDQVRSTFSVWFRASEKSHYYGPRDLNKFTESLAGDFLSVLSAGNVTELGGRDIYVPAQAPAPLRFQSKLGYLDVLSDRQLAPDEPRVVGAARTCRDGLADLAEYAGFSNAVPSFPKKVARIDNILATVLSGEYDDNLIVQLGTEVHALSSRIWQSKEQLGESAFAEAASFFALLDGFLAQFEIWMEYRGNLPPASGSSEQSSYPVAHELLLKIQVSPDVATQPTRDRVEGYLEGMDDQSANEEAVQGALRSAENIAAQAASQAVEFAKSEGLEFGKEVASIARKRAAGGLTDFFFKNIGAFSRLAEVRNIEWLRTLIDGMK